MKQSVVIDCVRTPVGRAHPERGAFRQFRSDDLAVACVQALVERTGIDPEEIEDVVMGNTQQTGEQGFNVARNVSLMSGLSVHTGGVTINRLCGSSLQALNQATHAIMAGFEDVHIVGGLEHMHHLPMDHGLDINPKLFQRTSKGALMMGITAEFLAQTQQISRDDQDQFALASHQKAAEATSRGDFQQEIVPIYGLDESGGRTVQMEDQCIRADTSLAALGQLNPAFMPGMGTVTAGNSSPLNDGAAAMLLMSAEKRNHYSWSRLPRFVPRQSLVWNRRSWVLDRCRLPRKFSSEQA